MESSRRLSRLIIWSQLVESQRPERLKSQDGFRARSHAQRLPLVIDDDRVLGVFRCPLRPCASSVVDTLGSWLLDFCA
jgi:hypothetical protein